MLSGRVFHLFASMKSARKPQDAPEPVSATSVPLRIGDRVRATPEALAWLLPAISYIGTVLRVWQHEDGTSMVSVRLDGKKLAFRVHGKIYDPFAPQDWSANCWERI